MEEKSKSNGPSPRTLHEVYLGIILLGTITILLAVKWYQIEKLVELVSFALTISSLLLAVFAIGYSIYSGTWIERGVGNLLVAVQSVRSSASEIETLRDSLTKSLETLSVATDTMGLKIEAQSGAIAKLAEQRSMTTEAERPSHASTDRATDRTVDVSEAAVGAAPKVEASVGPEDPVKRARRFVEYGSISGGIGVLAAARCQEKGRPIDLEHALKNTFVTPAYVQGYLVAASTLGILEVAVTEKSIAEASDFALTGTDVKAALIAKLDRGPFEDSFRNKFQKQLLEIDAAFVASPELPKGEAPA